MHECRLTPWFEMDVENGETEHFYFSSAGDAVRRGHKAEGPGGNTAATKVPPSGRRTLTQADNYTAPRCRK